MDNKDYKKTLKLTWHVESASKAPFTPVKCYHFDHIIAKAVLDKEEDFKQYCDHKTEFEFELLGDSEMKSLRKGDIIQISRRGYFIVDEAFKPAADAAVKDGVLSGQHLVLFNIPEGNKRESPTSYMSITNQKYKSAEMAEEAEAKGTQKSDGKENKQPAATPSKSAEPQPESNKQLEDLNEKIKAQGTLVRNLKEQKAAKEQLDAEVKNLLKLKEEFKTLAKVEWKPDMVFGKAESGKAKPKAAELSNKIKECGDKIRNLKSAKASKEDIDKEVKQLLDLKQEYKSVTGEEWKPDEGAPQARTTTKKEGSDGAPKKQEKQQPAAAKDDGAKKQTR